MFNESNIVRDKESSLLIFHYYDDAIIAPSLILSLFFSCTSPYSNIHYYKCISTTSIKSRSNHHEYKSQDFIHHYHHNSRYEKFPTYLFIISTRVLLVSLCLTYWLQGLHRVLSYAYLIFSIVTGLLLACHIINQANNMHKLFDKW